jgi:hypothetical protein
MNKYCKEYTLTYETLKHLKNMTHAGEWMVSFDLTDLYTRHTGRGQRLLYGKSSWRIVPTSRPTDGLEVRQLLLLSYYHSYHPTPSRAAAQPHRAHPPLVCEPTTHGAKTLPTLLAQLAMERRPFTPVHGRRLFAVSKDASL